VRWTQDGANISLTQSGEYPFRDSVSFELTTSMPKEFVLNLRIPEWAQEARIEVNGKRHPVSPTPGTFANISREWQHGDRVELQLPRKLRLETIDDKHADTVALLCGPLVLFAINEDDSRPALTRSQLLAARQTGSHGWEAGTGDNRVRFLPYVAIDEEQYSSYLHVT